MRSLAKGTEIAAGGFAGVQRLKQVRVENGWIYGRQDKECEPLEEYWRGAKPHHDFARLPGSTNALKMFCEKYGAVVETVRQSHRFGLGVSGVGAQPSPAAGSSKTDKDEVGFPEWKFWYEQWQFQLLFELSADLKKGSALQHILERALSKAEQKSLLSIQRGTNVENEGHRFQKAGAWQAVIRELSSSLGVTDPQAFSESGLEYTKELIAGVRQRLTQLNSKDLRKVAASYVERAVNQELRPLRPLVDLSSENGPQLYSVCDNLKQRLYWMLALDLASQRLPCVCVVCGSLFSASRENAVYCAKRKCRELGRKRRNWQKRKGAYNRARREKYKPKRKSTMKETRQ